MNKKSYRVAFANDGVRSINYDVISKWTPKRTSIIGSNVFFDIDGTFVSMGINDYKEIFG